MTVALSVGAAVPAAHADLNWPAYDSCLGVIGIHYSDDPSDLARIGYHQYAAQALAAMKHGVSGDDVANDLVGQGLIRRAADAIVECTIDTLM